MGYSKSKGASDAGHELHAAARSGDLVAVQTICSSNPLAINSRDKHSRTPLHLAAWSGQANVVDYLCKNKADIGAAAMDDMGAVHFAAQKGHLEVVRTLLSCGVPIKASNRKGMTALHCAVQGSHFDLAKYLVKKGADPHAKNKAGRTPLDLASDEEIRSLLLECGDNSNLKVGNKSESGEKREEATGEGVEEAKDRSMKRKDVNCHGAEEKLEQKKAKVALSHLLASDDTQEDQEHL